MAEELDLCMSQGTEMSSVMNNLQMGSVCVVYDGCVCVPFRSGLREKTGMKSCLLFLWPHKIFFHFFCFVFLRRVIVIKGTDRDSG